MPEYNGFTKVKAEYGPVWSELLRMACASVASIPTGQSISAFAQHDTLPELNGAKGSVPCRVDRHRAIFDAEHDPHVCKEYGKVTPSCWVMLASTLSKKTLGNLSMTLRLTIRQGRGNLGLHLRSRCL